MYHLHLVDESDAFWLTSRVNAASLFAHFAFRCNHLRNHIVLSASVLDNNTEKSNIAISDNANMHIKFNERSAMELLEALVRGEFNKTKHGNNHKKEMCDSNNPSDNHNANDDDDECISIDSNLSEDDNEEERKREEMMNKLPFQSNAVNHHDIYSYGHFHSSFAMTEAMLRKICTNTNNKYLEAQLREREQEQQQNEEEGNQKGMVAPYFDFIVATSRFAFDQLVSYYSLHACSNNYKQQNCNYTSSHDVNTQNMYWDSDTFMLIDKPLCILYIQNNTRQSNNNKRVGDDSSTLNACCLLQRFIEKLIAIDIVENNRNDRTTYTTNANTNKMHDTWQWVERVDTVVAFFAHEYGVQVLFSMVKMEKKLGERKK